MMYEAMRMATPLHTLLPRIAVKDHMLLNIPITKGTMVTTGFITNGYNPQYF